MIRKATRNQTAADPASHVASSANDSNFVCRVLRLLSSRPLLYKRGVPALIDTPSTTLSHDTAGRHRTSRMAFMIPIVKKDYNLYQSGRETPSPCGSVASRSGNSSLSCSPGFNMEDKYKDSKKSSSSRTGSWTSSSSSTASKFSKFNEAVVKKLGQAKNPR
ncbi:hypothetical protein HPB47_002447 [Ixodes persulcatus]|uniref:Uncharacterized protein n=1 Tax=Ixodes persulcatus TaxID=34615 RepID=A0AC60PL68_IXOPE|nr:hypothetical protein HPB47_002447 [Ixodes persulcatus]